ncbi:hypothetical protein CSTERTH_00815 [Thermoclostridium stercorarium subsp. thermolacticum DSM 2910]|uniref:Lipoprotein n=3 Tax=Thermoclostridium stercorarium TaxID=1510 RepID=A0A1B1YHI8_THEST|nr:hypothetical protein [Thermoclostridium stercorarium]ANW97672.1 hypothetical protein CSTERTH_00815 [Thermoclostridium stercorarium subsp. thermolacticum DSM 2910]ANX00235.1 hypothetical protein CSTERLE_00820 [Thermoclostridium stercorarium subsp. leptospartum DSM 9219]
MKNKIFSLFAIVLITACITAGCSARSEQSPMNVYHSVLSNQSQFFSTDARKQLYISQLNQAVSEDSTVRAEVTKFTVIDLDKDDMPEVILRLTVNGDDYFGSEVLKYQDGEVYGYTLWYRAFMDLKEDGTFSFSGGASDWGCGTISFTKEGYNVDGITYCESEITSDNNETVFYYVNGEKASYEEFQSAIDEQGKKTDVTWYDLTDENIKNLLSN